MADDEREPERPHVLFPLEQDAPSKQWLMQWTTKWLNDREMVSMFETQIYRQMRRASDG